MTETCTAMSAIHNPYWDEVKHRAKPSDHPWEHNLQVERFSLTEFRTDPKAFEPELDRHDFVKRYSWSITDPDSVAFVAEHSAPGLVDPLAGTGYWAYLLGQAGVDTYCYDLRPGEKSNPWHKGAELWAPVAKLDGAKAAAQHPDRTLLLAWPPYSEDVGARVLAAYKGRKVIYIGEYGGCTGDYTLFELFDEHWDEVAEHVPVQWWGLHDRITIYERKSVLELEATA